MANWRNERFGQRSAERDRWPDEWRRDWDVETRDRGARGYGGSYGPPQDWRRSDEGFGDDTRYGAGSGRRGFGGRDAYQEREPDFGRSSYADRDERGRGGTWRDQSYPSDWGPDWGDHHGRYQTRNAGYGWSGEYPTDYGYGRDRDQGRGYGRNAGRNPDRDFWDRASDEVASWFGDDEAEQRRRMDERQDHRGRGPKGYTRSDDRIREDVSDALSDDPMVDASEITVRVSSSEVTLDGTVHSRAAKHRAEHCAERISGVNHVQNNLRVQEPSSFSTTSGEASGSATRGGSSSGGMSAGATATGATTTGARQRT